MNGKTVNERPASPRELSPGIDSLGSLSQSQKAILKNGHGIMDVRALAAILSDAEQGLPGVCEELALDSEGLERLRAEITELGRLSRWEAFPEGQGKWQAPPSPMGFRMDADESEATDDEGGPE